MEREDSNVDRLVALLAALVIGCGGAPDTNEVTLWGEAGAASQSETGGTETGGSESDTGGSEPTGGTATGGTPTGGAVATGGAEETGGNATGGSTGGAVPATGGTATGSAGTGGAGTGGVVPTGGTETGGSATGGVAAGGTLTTGGSTGGSESTGGDPTTGGTESTGGTPCLWTCTTTLRTAGSSPVVYVTETGACSEEESDNCTVTESGSVHVLCGPGGERPETTECPRNDSWSCEYWRVYETGNTGGNVILPGGCADPCSRLADDSCDFAFDPCEYVGQVQCTPTTEYGYQVCGECLGS